MPHNAAVEFFARATQDDTYEILRELFRTDECKVISVLGDLNRRRAEKLIRPLTDSFPWLADLPKAAEDIALHATSFDLGDDRSPVKLARAARGSEPEGTYCYVRAYERGTLYWSDKTVCTVNGQIAAHYANVGGPNGELGFPQEQNAVFAESRGRAKGTAQRFEKGIVCSSNLGTYTVSEPFSELYQSIDGVGGWLGFPISSNESYDIAQIQRFEGGDIFSSTYGTFSVRKAVSECARGWLPVSNEVATGKSPVSGQSGKVQSFRGLPGGRMIVYSSNFGIYIVGWKILKYYQAQGGSTSQLGFPVSRIEVVKEQGYTQVFEGGAVYLQAASGRAITVPPSTIDRLKKDRKIAERLGWPTSEEKGIESGGLHVQRFDNGIVTREVDSEIWLRP